MKRLFVQIGTFVMFLFITAQMCAQNVGINADGSAPHSSAGLDVKFSDKGLLIPRVAINDVNLATPITTPAEGLLVYNETGMEAKGFYYWNGTKWVLLLSGAGANNDWKLTGNAGTVDGTNFIGTTDNVPLNFKVNNEKAGRIGLSGDASVFLGYQAGNSDDKTNNQNTGIGYQALYSNTTGEYNTANGSSALYSNTEGIANAANGSYALYSNTTGDYNTATGSTALYSNTTGEYNTATGSYALYSNTEGDYNTANGNEALFTNTTGDRNTANGYQSLYSNTTGYHNTGVGLSSLYSNTTGFNNQAYGYQSLYSNTTGFNNTAVGLSSLYSNTTGVNNTGVGTFALNNLTTGSNNTALGYNAQVPSGTGSNQVRIGNADVTYAGVQVAWTITSDRRWKTNIQESPLGLSFIKSLRPVVYTRKNDEQQKPEYGFIAQEMEEALQKAGVNPQGVITIDDEGMYGVRSNDLMAPMVKSIQELSAENAELKKKNEEIEKKNEELESRLERLEKLLDK